MIKNVFDKIFPDSKVVNAKCLLRLDYLYKLACQLREFKKEYRYYRNLNSENKERATIKKRKSCFKGSHKHDAEEYYKYKVK